MGCYTYSKTLRFLLTQKLCVLVSNQIGPSVDYISVFVSLKNVVNYGDFRIWQALFLINFFTGKGGRVVVRGYKRKGREKLYQVEVCVMLKGDIIYEFLYFLYGFVFYGLEFGGLYKYELVVEEGCGAVFFFSIGDIGDVDIFESRSEFVGWDRPLNVLINLSKFIDNSLLVCFLSSLKFLEEEEDEELFNCEW